MFGQNKSFGSSSFGSSGGGLFGNSQNKTSLFGGSQQNTGGSSLFGSAQNKPASSGIFGQASSGTSSIFGSPQQPQNSGGSIFGSSNNANKSIFGSSTANSGSGGIFGSTASNTGGSSIFGSSSNSTGGNLFGSSNNTVTGTTVKFEPPIGTDTMLRNGTSQNISTKHMCISAMPKYESKSMEELRIEDYVENRKTPGASAAASGGLFGSSTTNPAGSSLFGSSTPQKSMFGSTTNSSSPFGGTASNTNSGGSLFGNTSNQGSSLFGSGNKPATGGGLFGNTSTTFGQPSTGTTSLFGNNQGQQQQQTGLFGQTQQPQQQTSSLFGSSTNTGGSLFGNQTQQPASTGFNFGGSSNTTNKFGQQATNTSGGNLFGSSNNTSGSLFGSKPATSGGFGFGSQPAATSTFGQTNASSGGLFGNTANKPGGLFGNTSTTGNTGGTLFGSQPATGGGLFGSNTQQTQPLGTGFGNTVQPATVVQPQVAPVPVIGVTADVLQMQANMNSLKSQLTNAPYGDSPLLKYGTPEKDNSDSQLSAQRQLRFLAAKKGASAVNSPIQDKSSFIAAPVTKIMSDLTPSLKSNETSRDLNYSSKEAPPTLGRVLRNGLDSANSSILNRTNGLENRTIDSAIEASLNGTSNRLGMRGSVRKSNLKQLDLSALADTSRYTQNVSQSNDPDVLPLISEGNNVVGSPQCDPVQAAVQRNQERVRQPPTLNLDTTSDETGFETEKGTSNTGSSASAVSVVIAHSRTDASCEKSISGVKLTKADYFTIPTINEMKNMVKNGKVVIENGLTIGRASYGSVFWPGVIELKDINLDEVVIFRHREVTVYPNEEEKPDEGEGLNRPAEVTLERVWYTDRKSKQEIRDVVKLAEIGWREYLEEKTIKMGAIFKDYRAETGSWVFRVEHFSKYGLADDDEPMETTPPANTASVPLQQLDLNTSSGDVQSRVQRQHIHKNGFPMTERQFIIENGNSNISNIIRTNGLGGGIGNGDEETHNTIEFQMDTEDDGIHPEKKLKLEILTDLEYESNRYIKNFNEVKLMPKCIEPKHKFQAGFFESEVLGFGKSKLIDLSITKGRSAGVGWSTVGSLVWSAQPEFNQILWGTVDRSSEVSQSIISDMMEINVSASESCRKGPSSNSDTVRNSLVSNYVRYSQNYSVILERYMEVSKNGGFDSHNSVWKLCSSLFPISREGDWIFERGEQVGDWLRNETLNHVQNTFDQNKSGASSVWNYLCIGNVEKAFEAASAANMLHLASSLYASMVCPEATINCYREQVECWKNNEVLDMVNPDILKCYLILSGVSYKEWTVNGKKHSINCLEGLHWTQALGIHVWYLRGWKGLEEAYLGYVCDVEAGRAASSRGYLFGELIKLACESSHSVEVVLDCASGENHHDYFLMWHLWSVLNSVGYRTMSKIAETRLHRGYSAQLEELKLEKFGVFVLQHIVDDDERAIAVRSMLERMARFSDNEMFKTICEECDISKEWAADAQYVFAKENDDSILLFELAVESMNVEAARKLFSQDIAPNAIVSGDLRNLRDACKIIQKIENLIPEWGANGRIFVDYSELMDAVERGGEIDELQQILNDLEDRLHAPIVNKTTIEKLALQSIARQVFEYRAENNSIPEWTTLLGSRQIYKIFRDQSTWENDRYKIECD